ncbi:MAG: hypothetical protein IKD23_07315 [Lentisphaeria bacterium]|nr:hypothetical protein [Lentisphaeria bacterium]
MISLQKYLSDFYSPDDYAALAAQMERWKISRPLSSAKILDGTPVFRNTMVKYMVLLAAGADLTVSAGKDIPCDPAIIRMLPDFGIRIADEKILREKFDVVADCAGRHINVSSRCGYAELTRSGLEYYRNCRQPVFSVDSGILKRFETTLGTGESFVRAMNQLGFNDFKNKKIVVFGGGKVGCGTAFFASKAGAETFIVDTNNITPPPGTTLVAAQNKSDVIQLISGAWCVVSATGLPGVLAEYVPQLLEKQPLIANMGVEDEFGPALPENCVLNHKLPLNFILSEPTRINFIDPSMALSNEALLLLLQGKVAPGINLPPQALEQAVINDMRNSGKMNKEIDLILKGKFL